MGFNEPTLLTVAYFCFLAATVVYVLHLIRGNVWIARGVTGIGLIGFLALSGGLVVRGIQAGHWPLTSTYEFCLVFVWSIVSVYLLLEWDMGTRAGGPFVLAIAFLLFTYARVGIPTGAKAVQPLLPSLRTLWLQLHVVTAALAYGSFATACGAGIMYLSKEFSIRRSEAQGEGGTASDAGETRPYAFEPLPALSLIDKFGFRAVSFGYPWLTLAIITGAIWAQIAWGRYWNWDIKETWALITWLVYTLFLHARVLKGWRGRPVALLSIAGFIVVLFTFLGVGWLARQVGLESLHVY